jgi:hypothetical protein
MAFNTAVPAGPPNDADDWASPRVSANALVATTEPGPPEFGPKSKLVQKLGQSAVEVEALVPHAGDANNAAFAVDAKAAATATVKVGSSPGMALFMLFISRWFGVLRWPLRRGRGIKTVRSASIFRFKQNSRLTDFSFLIERVT